jgi:hypothetical protein
MLWLWAGVFVVGWVFVDGLLRILERLGWIHWRRRRRRRAGAALSPIAGLFDPTAHHLQDAQEERVLEEEAAGDGSGKRRDITALNVPPPAVKVTGAATVKPPTRRDGPDQNRP